MTNQVACPHCQKNTDTLYQCDACALFYCPGCSGCCYQGRDLCRRDHEAERRRPRTLPFTAERMAAIAAQAIAGFPVLGEERCNESVAAALSALERTAFDTAEELKLFDDPETLPVSSAAAAAVVREAVTQAESPLRLLYEQDSLGRALLQLAALYAIAPTQRSRLCVINCYRLLIAVAERMKVLPGHSLSGPA